MRKMKKISLIFASLVLLITCTCQMAAAEGAEPRASLYLQSYGASLSVDDSGLLNIDYDVVATRISDRVGVSKIVIYKLSGSREATITGTVANGLLREDSRIHAGNYYYQGEPGVTYFALLTMYAVRDGGSDSKSYITNNAP